MATTVTRKKRTGEQLSAPAKSAAQKVLDRAARRLLEEGRNAPGKEGAA